MSTLAFFPWLRIQNELKLGSFRLLPYQRFVKPGGDVQDALDAVLDPYRDPTHPVRYATLVQVGKHEITDDLSRSERRELFLFSELLAFSALARREFFGLGIKYTNRHQFILYVQQFTDPSGSVSLTQRRRDGATKTLVTRSAFTVRRPFNVMTCNEVELDPPLVRALMKARRKGGVHSGVWPPYHDAIVSFNYANTDSDVHFLPEVIDVWLMYAAFERLLGCSENRNRLSCVSKAFPKVFATTANLPRAEWKRVPTQQRGQYKTLREAWVRDLYKVRGSLAHGHTKPLRASLWRLEEHAILAAFAFPRLVKAKLYFDGFYKPVPRDQKDIDVFELLLCEDLLRPPADQHSSADWGWNRAVAKAARHRLARALAPQIEAALRAARQRRPGRTRHRNQR